MTTIDWVLNAAAAFNVGCAVYIVVNIRRWKRGMYRIEVLDRLLTEICIDAYRNQHQPIWQAWAETMGTISVAVEARRKGWSEE